MASWKKVIVSGSRAELLNVTSSGYRVTGSAFQQFLGAPNATGGTIITGSFSGSYSGSFSGDGSGLTNILATTLAVPTPVSNLVNSDFILVSASSGYVRILYSDLLTDLAGTNLAVDNNDSLTLASSLTGLTSIISTSITGSLSGSVIGTASWASNVNGNIFTSNNPALSASYALNAGAASSATQVANSLTAGSGISMTPYNGSTSTAINVKTGSVFSDDTILKWDTGANAFESSSLTDNGTVISGNTSIQLTGANSRLSGSFSGSFRGDGSGLSNVGTTINNNTDNYLLTATGGTSINGEPNLTFDSNTNVLNVQGAISANGYITLGGALTANGTINLNNATIDSNKATINLLSNATPTTINFGNAGSTINIGNNLVINGDLTANGTSSFINSTNLLVADRFAVFASGSNTTADAGIIIQTSSLPAGTGSGIALYLETASPTAPRWAVSPNVYNNATSAVPNSYMVTVTSSGAFPSAAPFWGGSGYGYGNIYINSDDESIWIYS